MKFRWGITQKLTLIFLLFAAALLVGVGLTAYYGGRVILEEAAFSELLARATEKEAALFDWLDEHQSHITRLSRSPHLLAATAALQASQPNSATAQRMHEQLVQTLQFELDLEDAVELFILHPETGQVIVSTDPLHEGNFNEDPPFFLQGKKEPYIQSEYPSFVLQDPSIVAAAPLQSEEGRVLGVLAARLKLNKIGAIMQRRTDQRQTYDAFLLNTAHLFVTQPNLLDDPAVLRRGIYTEVPNRCLAGNSGTLTTPDYRGVPAITVYRWLAEQQLCLIVKIDQAEAFAPIYAFAQALLLGGILALGIASALALWLAGTFTRPIHALQAGAARLRHGELDLRLPETATDELGRLASEFNQMAAALAEKENQLRRYNEELEQLVEDQITILSASETELRALFAAMTDIILVLDAEGRYLKIAPTNPALLYRPPDKVVGQTVHETLPTEQADLVLGGIRRALELSQPVNIEYNWPLGDQEIWFNTTISPLQADTVICVARDITQRKQIEQELQKLSRAVEQSASTVVITDTEGYIEYANPRFTETTGYTLAEALGQHIRILKSGQTPPAEYRRLWATITAGKEWRGELCNQKKNGELFWESTTISPLKNTQGVITQFLAVKEDTTGRRQVEEALRQSREKYRLVVDNIKEVIFQVDAAGCFTFLNWAWTEILGFPLKECLGTSYLDYIHPDDRQSIAGFFQALWDQDLDYCRHTFRFIARDGRLCWIEVYAKLTQDSNGAIPSISGTLNDISDRKRAEQALQASETRFRTLATHAPVGILETDAQGEGVFVNQHWCDLTGMTVAESLGPGWTKALQPDDRGSVFAEWITAAQAGRASAREYRLQTPAGKVFWVSGKAIVLRDEAGEITGYLGTIIDITESKQMREQLAQDAVQLMLINDVSNQIAAVLDLDQVLDRAASLVQEIFGYHHVALFLLDNDIARLKAIAGSYTDYFPANHTQELDRGIIGWVATHGERIVANDIGQDVRYISKIADDTVTRAELCLPIKIAGQTIGVLDIQSPRLNAFSENDIISMETLVAQIAVAIENARLYQAVQLELTERKQAEQALAQERNLLRTLIDHIPDPIYVKDIESRFLLNNQAHVHILGYQRQEEIYSKTDFDVFPSEFAAKYYGDEQELVRSGQPLINHEEMAIDSQGRELYLLTSKIPLQDNDGKITGFVGISRDITGLKRVQDELRQAKEAAEAADRAKSAFLANMSHEIRTPLNAIIGMTSLLLDTPLAQDQREFAETVRISGDTLLALINDILDFSKIEAGKLELEEQPFDLRQSIEQALDLVAVKASEKKLELAYLVDDHTPGAIVGDVVRLRQILVNLLSNAVKFTEAGEVIVAVTSVKCQVSGVGCQVSGVKCQVPGNSANVTLDTGTLATGTPDTYELHFAVHDTGLGIPPERMDRLFKAFSQVDASTTRKYGGTGLGLAISNRLCQLMGGKMWVESKGIPGQGSTFHFTIRTTAAPSQPRIYLRGQHAELIGKRLLIVDDNATNCLMLEHQAQTWGMSSTIVAAGAEALELIRLGHRFDLAILDMHMPEMDGLTLAAEIRRLEEPMTRTSSPASRRLPLLMLTSLGGREVGDPTNGVEFAAILNKPIKSAQLYDTLIRIFNQQPIKVNPDSGRPSPFDGQLGRRHPLRILLAEDNVVNQKVALRFLDKLGYRANVAANGREAIAALEDQAYDVVLMDVQMPDMDGLEATRLIHQQWPAARRPRIIAMTANALQGDRELCLEAGMDDYIGKPVRIEELSRALSESQPHLEAKEVTVQPEGVAAPETTALDPDALAELRDLLGEQAAPMIAELINLFIDNGLALLKKMQAAAQAGDMAELYRGAHTLIPGAAHLGAMRLAALCRELEELGRADRLEEAVAKFTELEAEFGRAKLALEAERGG
ncbi:MAG: PAS domain S-box protein [Chloroflexota bacterium]